MANPQILISPPTIESENTIFLKFLNNPNHPANRTFILNAFPELKAMIDAGDSEDKAVEKIIKEFYSVHKEKIDSITQFSEDLVLRHSKEMLTSLGNIMEYIWPQNSEYIAIPTILPFSPFEKPKFYFSILEEIRKGSKKNILQIAIHEISHFIFFDYYKDIKNKTGISLSRAAEHYLKEALTAVVLNIEPLKSQLDLTDYKGNKEIHDINFDIDGRITSIMNYIVGEYSNSKKQNKNFWLFVENLIMDFHKIDIKLVGKRNLWNKNGYGIYKNELLFREYSHPIKLDN